MAATFHYHMLSITFFMRLPRPTEIAVEQVMGPQTGQKLVFLLGWTCENLRHALLGVVIAGTVPGTPPNHSKASRCPSRKASNFIRRKRMGEYHTAVPHPHDKHMNDGCLPIHLDGEGAKVCFHQFSSICRERNVGFQGFPPQPSNPMPYRRLCRAKLSRILLHKPLVTPDGGVVTLFGGTPGFFSSFSLAR